MLKAQLNLLAQTRTMWRQVSCVNSCPELFGSAWVSILKLLNV